MTLMRTLRLTVLAVFWLPFLISIGIAVFLITLMPTVMFWIATRPSTRALPS